MLTTERLVLRPVTAADVDAALRIHADPRTNTHNPTGPMRDRAAAETLIAQWLDDWATHSVGYWAVATREVPDAVLGFSGIRQLDWRAASPGGEPRRIYNLYYRYAPEAWGHGYAGEVATRAVEFWREVTPRLPLLARTLASNIPSQRTAERAGLVRRPDLDGYHEGAEEIVFALGDI